MPESNQDEQIRVILIDDHPVVRSGIRNILEEAGDIVVEGESDNGEAALRLVEELSPDVLLLDMEMPGLSGVEVAQELQHRGAEVKVLALSAYDDEHYIRELLSSGAAGYLTKEEAMDAIVEAVRGIARGEEGWLSRRAAASMAAWTREDKPTLSDLTDREAEVLELVARGWTSARVANELDISERTVRFHLSNVYGKLGVNSRAEAIAWAVKQGMGEDE